MPVFERGDATIQYDLYGEGHPLILFAPGGMNSVARLWRERPDAPGQPMPWIDPTTSLAGDFLVISMDQRNAGASRAPVREGDGWRTYTEDHLALLDHLGIERTHTMGGCIGSSFCLGLCEAAPERVTAAVLQNPIGLSEDNRGDFMGMYDGWAEGMRTRADVTDAALASQREAMFSGDFVFSVGRDFVRSCPIPLLVLSGRDQFHPEAVAREIAELAPDAKLVLEWAGKHEETLALVRDFLLSHTPA